jgi:hypothetical protein
MPIEDEHVYNVGFLCKRWYKWNVS